MNGSSLTSLLVFALTAALSPFSLIAFSLVLATKRGPRNGLAFIAGWIFTVMLIGVGVAILGSNVPVHETNTAGKRTLALELALGVVLLVVWLRRRARGPAASRSVEENAPANPEPGWQRKLSTMGYGGAFLAGGLVQTWPVMIAAGLEVVRLNMGPVLSLEWMLLFAVSTTAGIAVLEVLAWRNPGSAVERLDRIRGYVDQHRDAVINWLILLAGLWLVFRGLLGLF